MKVLYSFFFFSSLSELSPHLSTLLQSKLWRITTGGAVEADEATGEPDRHGDVNTQHKPSAESERTKTHNLRQLSKLSQLSQFAVIISHTSPFLSPLLPKWKLFRNTDKRALFIASAFCHVVAFRTFCACVRALTRVVVDHIFEALKSEPRGDVVPAVVQSEDTIVLYDPVLHRQRIHT